MANQSKHRPVYVISVAAELVDMHPQTLRLYERKGLIRPGRSTGKTRLYSERDIEHLREIRRLTQELGVNLAGVEEVMRLQHELDDMQGEFEAEIERIEGDPGVAAGLLHEQAQRVLGQVGPCRAEATLRVGEGEADDLLDLGLA